MCELGLFIDMLINPKYQHQKNLITHQIIEIAVSKYAKDEQVNYNKAIKLINLLYKAGYTNPVI